MQRGTPSVRRGVYPIGEVLHPIRHAWGVGKEGPLDTAGSDCNDGFEESLRVDRAGYGRVRCAATQRLSSCSAARHSKRRARLWPLVQEPDELLLR